MLTPLQERALSLYREGKTLREVAVEVQRSHEWVRKTLVKAGEDSRNRGREPLTRPACRVCNKVCPKPEALFCSRGCLSRHRHDAALKRLEKAQEVLKRGGTYAEAAEAAGFKNSWHLWGRLHHFGLTEGLRTAESCTSVESPAGSA